MKELMTKTWSGASPKTCDACSTPLTDVFFDAKAADGTGRWGNFCRSCFNKYTYRKLGTGFGQKYQRNGDRWEKVA